MECEELPKRPQIQARRQKTMWQQWGQWTFGPFLHITHLLTSVPPWAWPCIYHFHMMMEFCCVRPTSWFRLHDGLLRLRDNLVARAWLSSESLLRPRSRPKTVYQKNYHLHMMERLWSTFLSACTVIHLHKPAKDFRKLPSLSLPLQAPLDLSFTPHKWQRILHSSLDLFQSLLMFCAPFKISSSLGHLVNGQE